ncbi:MAG: GntR family transcriptional regulator [Pseudomonadota bacterium]|uniref:GntR family transcriptional regulator n=1 Tax=Sphingomonas sp. ERG5 TaxID=1381597 RepID=UPI000AAE563B|nr:GntR family transcriptional regulator [Sphingomonas sp. ERG5]
MKKSDIELGELGSVDRLNAIPLYHQIFLQLREEITSGERPLGSRMPTEQELAANFGVSRITARRALAELADTNLVARKRRVGTTVIFEPPARPIEGSIDQAIESLLTFGRSTQVKLIELGEAPARAPISEALGVAVGTPLIRVVRVRSLDGEPLGHLISYVPTDLGEHITRAGLRSTPILALIEQAGVKIGAATQTISATLADATLAATLAVEVGSPILRISRTVTDVNGRPVQHILAQYRPDRYQIRLDLHKSKAEMHFG